MARFLPFVFLLSFALAPAAYAEDGFNSAGNTPLPIGAGDTVAMKIWPKNAAATGNVGLGLESDPGTNLSVARGVKLGTDEDYAADPVNCTKKGTLSFDKTKSVLFYCDGANWAAVPAQ